MKDNCDKAGMIFEAIRMDSEYIMLRKVRNAIAGSTSIVGNIQKASQVGVKVITHHWTVIPIRRNAHIPGRGGLPTLRLSWRTTGKICRSERQGRSYLRDYWERITYFSKR